MRKIHLALVVLLLVGCGATGSRTASSPAASTGSMTAVARPDAAHIAAGVAAFKAAFPALAKGRTDKAIGDDVDNTCFNVAQGQMEHAVILRLISRRFERNGITPSTAQSEAILKAIQIAACPAS